MLPARAGHLRAGRVRGRRRIHGRRGQRHQTLLLLLLRRNVRMVLVLAEAVVAAVEFQVGRRLRRRVRLYGVRVSAVRSGRRRRCVSVGSSVSAEPWIASVGSESGGHFGVHGRHVGHAVHHAATTYQRQDAERIEKKGPQNDTEISIV